MPSATSKAELIPIRGKDTPRCRSRRSGAAVGSGTSSSGNDAPVVLVNTACGTPGATPAPHTDIPAGRWARPAHLLPTRLGTGLNCRHEDAGNRGVGRDARALPAAQPSAPCRRRLRPGSRPGPSVLTRPACSRRSSPRWTARCPMSAPPSSTPCSAVAGGVGWKSSRRRPTWPWPRTPQWWRSQPADVAAPRHRPLRPGCLGMSCSSWIAWFAANRPADRWTRVAAVRFARCVPLPTSPTPGPGTSLTDRDESRDGKIRHLRPKSHLWVISARISTPIPRRGVTGSNPSRHDH